MVGYFTKLKRIWDQMKVLNTFMICNCDCMCGAKTHNAKINEDQKLIQLLMGLNDAYFDAIESILMMKPLPSIAHAYSALLHQESQREVHSNSSSITDSTTFRTSGQKWNAQRTTNDYKSTNLSYNAGIKKNDLYCNYGKKNLGMLRKNTTYW